MAKTQTITVNWVTISTAVYTPGQMPVNLALSCKRSVVVRILTNLTYGGRVCASLLLLRLALLSHGPAYRCSERSRDSTGYNCKLLQALTTVRNEKYANVIAAKLRNNACMFFGESTGCVWKNLVWGRVEGSLVPRLENWDVGSGTRLDVYFVALATRNQIQTWRISLGHHDWSTRWVMNTG